MVNPLAGLDLLRAQQQLPIQGLGALGAYQNQAWTNSTATANWATAMAYTTDYVPPKVSRFRFFRINTEVEEGAEREPLDELRIKVAKWLRRI